MELTIEKVYEKFDEDYLTVIEKNLEKEVYNNLDEAMKRQASLYAFFGGVLAHAKHVCEQTEIALEGSKAHFKLKTREKSILKGFKVTDKSLEAAVDADPDIFELKIQLVGEEFKFNLIRNFVSALEHQKDMLIQLSANRRTEAKTINSLT